MPRTGYCSECDADVELTEEDTCPSGHSSDRIFDVREQDVALESQQQQTTEGARRAKKATWLWVAAAVIAILGVAAMASSRDGSPVPPSQPAAPSAPQPEVPAAEALPQDGVQNASFEDWSNPVPAGWYLSGIAEGGMVTRRPDWKKSGANGAALQNSSDNPAESTELWQPIVVTAGTTYKASVWVLSDRKPSCVILSIRFVDATGEVLEEASVAGDQAGIADSEMKQLVATGTAPEGAVTARLLLLLAGGNHVSGTPSPSTAVFDDLAFEASEK
ncbi:MAG: hypothetical protein Q8K99_11890 [Actinomycetota bacterium]|nr:hypothetical protein [Actinomycetota bacterium]